MVLAFGTSGVARTHRPICGTFHIHGSDLGKLVSLGESFAGESSSFRPLPKPGKSTRLPFPDWADYVPNSIWIYDTTHFTRAGTAVLIIEDLVSRTWITEIVSVEETSTQVELAFAAALEIERLLDVVDARHDDTRVEAGADDEARPILLAVSDNGAQMISGSTRECMALCAVAQHFGRPGISTDQAWIESLNGHLKREYPHLLTIEDPETLSAEIAVGDSWFNHDK